MNASTMYKDMVIICSGAKFGTWVVSSTTAAMSDAAFVIGCILIPIFLLLPFIPFHMLHPDLGGLPFFSILALSVRMYVSSSWIDAPLSLQ